jgi:hypothetical protein
LSRTQVSLKSKTDTLYASKRIGGTALVDSRETLRHELLELNTEIYTNSHPTLLAQKTRICKTHA